MRNLIVLPCIALLTAAGPATSAPAPIANQVVRSDSQQAVALSGGKTAPAAQDKKICKQLPSSSSRLPNRACLTAKEWQQVEDDASR